eukprot:Skav232171  [mRNA]  locus=scaffold4749:32750:48362:- [translate_table: standard]
MTTMKKQRCFLQRPWLKALGALLSQAMARVGVANYQHSTASPVLQDKYWREGLERAQRDHAFSCFNDPFPKASYAYINTTSNDFLGRTWQVLHHTTSTAAGKCSFHHNVAKPMSTVVKANSSTMSLEAKPKKEPQAPVMEWSMPIPQPGVSSRLNTNQRRKESVNSGDVGGRPEAVSKDAQRLQRIDYENQKHLGISAWPRGNGPGVRSAPERMQAMQIHSETTLWCKFCKGVEAMKSLEVFAAVTAAQEGASSVPQFARGYFIELILSMENVFVYEMILVSFRDTLRESEDEQSSFDPESSAIYRLMTSALGNRLVPHYGDGSLATWAMDLASYMTATLAGGNPVDHLVDHLVDQFVDQFVDQI